MKATRTVLAGLVLAFLVAGCLVAPGRRGGSVVVVPFLPPIVELGAEPYYVHEGYHYHYQNNGWYYANARTGPWVALPRDHYPKEVRYRKENNVRRDREPSHGHPER